MSDHLAVNRAGWAARNAAYTDRGAPRAWSRTEVTWGIFGAPERELRALPEVSGRDVVELGCGTGYFGAVLKRLGARRVIGIDPTEAQLATARRMEARHRLGVEFVLADAEQLPLEAEAFDLAVSEYGASIWCDPRRWIPEAHRVLRPGGELVFMRNSPLSILCFPDQGSVTTQLQRPQRDLYRLEWAGEEVPGIEFQPAHGELLRILRGAGFEVVDLVEVYAPEGAATHEFYADITAEWAQKWPAEEIWRARKPETAGSGRLRA